MPNGHASQANGEMNALTPAIRVVPNGVSDHVTEGREITSSTGVGIPAKKVAHVPEIEEALEVDSVNEGAKSGKKRRAPRED